MEISDFIFPYPGWGDNSRLAICRVRIFMGPDCGVSVLLTDLNDKNPGPSITNSVEFARAALIQKGHIKDTVRIIEHYEQGEYGSPEFDIVSFKNNSPNWDRIRIADLATILGCPQESLLEKTLSNERLVNEIEQIRNRINPFIDFPDEEPPEVIIRRDYIIKRMIPKRELSELVLAGARERELQALIKRDLSLVAEVYASPEEEYIAFSEFPIADGVVDFAVFSGRSRMDVTLIEIKGADFPIVNRHGYKNFAAKLNEADKQIKRRLGYIYREYAAYRKFVHSVRDEVESGKTLYNSLIGPLGDLQVDPQKDVSTHYVVIGGRTTDDIGESKFRHEYEISFNPNIKVESWDSWLKKLRRL